MIKLSKFFTIFRKCFDFRASSLSYFVDFENLDATGAVLYTGFKSFRASLDYAIRSKNCQKLFNQKFWGVPFSLPFQRVDSWEEFHCVVAYIPS